ncbi:MAG: ParB/RepB/Spo0J family partition protein [Butyrivibrio sp.]|jgi:ParB family chromosome partitioning protein|nr:ParB/RepB/Spo0J family partition protein [Butyrivibrio sp.]MCR4637546.1 ParB/RepB/Spo0J family partition protein [Butyrivibrio sp.]
MAVKTKRGLGRGLDSLIPAGESKKEVKKATVIVKEEKALESDESKKLIKITQVEPNHDQPRKQFDEDALQELAESIKQVGILEPLLVRNRDDHFEIIAGERRWRAARAAGIKEVPVVIRNDLTDQQIVEIQLIENIQRENLNPIEEAKAFHRLITEFNLKQDEVAERVSKSRVAITNSMRLLKLSDEVQQMIIDGKLTSGHARALISVEDKKLQLELAEKIFDEKLSVRQAEKLVKDLGKEKPAPKQPVVIDKNLENIYRDLEKRCKEKTGTKVAITPKGNNGGGKIEIEFYNNDDLEKITRMLLI